MIVQYWICLFNLNYENNALLCSVPNSNLKSIIDYNFTPEIDNPLKKIQLNNFEIIRYQIAKSNSNPMSRQNCKRQSMPTYFLYPYL